MVLTLLQKQVDATASLPAPQRILDVQTEQRYDDACIWELDQRHSGCPELYSGLHVRQGLAVYMGKQAECCNLQVRRTASCLLSYYITPPQRDASTNNMAIGAHSASRTR